MPYATDVFLSHNWGKDESGRDNHHRVSVVNKELKKLGYQTWFDDEKLTGSIVPTMSQGIDETNGVIVFITKRYLEKVNSNEAGDNCKLEFDYASRRITKSKMVPVVMEESMREPKTWTRSVGMILGGELYIDMTGDLENRTYLSKQMEVLQKELQSKGIQSLPGILFAYFTFQYRGKETTVFRHQGVSIKTPEVIRWQVPDDLSHLILFCFFESLAR